MLQRDGSIISLGTNNVTVNGVEIVFNGEVEKKEHLAKGNVSVTFAPGSATLPGDIDSLASLLKILENLGETAHSISSDLGEIGQGGNDSISRITSGSVIDNLDRILSSWSAIHAKHSDLLGRISADGLQTLFGALDRGREAFNWATSIKELETLNNPEPNVANSIEQYWDDYNYDYDSENGGIFIAEEFMKKYAEFPWFQNSTSSHPSKRDTEEGIYYILTVPGMPRNRFETLVDQIDGGSGHKLMFDVFDFFGYQTIIHEDLAKSLEDLPDIRLVYAIGKPQKQKANMIKRGIIKSHQRDSETRYGTHQRALGTPEKLAAGQTFDDYPPYEADESMGKGTWVYVLDSGFNMNIDVSTPIDSLRDLVLKDVSIGAQRRW